MVAGDQLQGWADTARRGSGARGEGASSVTPTPPFHGKKLLPTRQSGSPNPKPRPAGSRVAASRPGGRFSALQPREGAEGRQKPSCPVSPLLLHPPAP